MTREETLKTLSILKAAYPYFYSKLSKSEANGVVNLWADIFEHDNPLIVGLAVKELIKTHDDYPPNIAHVRNKMNELIRASSNEPTDEELWHCLRKAVSNGYYGYEEEYAKLPVAVQRFLGEPQALRTYSMIEEDTFNTVTHGQFLKQIKVINERERYSASLPQSVKDIINSLNIPKVGQNGEPDTNALRNDVTRQIEGAGY